MKNRIDTKLERERIGRVIKARRNELHIIMRQMEAETGIARGAISRMETGKDIYVHTLILACAYLDLKISLLIDVP